MYNASKAALDTYSNTLRLELLPFGVRVVSLVPAAVETNMTISGSFPSTLPGEGSIFKPAERHIARSRLPELMALDKFAEKVVVDLLAGATGRIWRGAFASRVWAIMTFCPGFVLVSQMP
jgi:NAD(P)-dependent dehydrogenase (short-subunit alcohol dehydrogenase family)